MSALPGLRDRTILMGGFSKAYAMTGWRVGYLAAPAAMLEGIVKVHQYGIMSAPTTAQDAALVALTSAEPTWTDTPESRRRRAGRGAERWGSRRSSTRRLLRLPENQSTGRFGDLRPAAARGGACRRSDRNAWGLPRGPRPSLHARRSRSARRRVRIGPCEPTSDRRTIANDIPPTTVRHAPRTGFAASCNSQIQDSVGREPRRVMMWV